MSIFEKFIEVVAKQGIKDDFPKTASTAIDALYINKKSLRWYNCLNAGRNTRINLKREDLRNG